MPNTSDKLMTLSEIRAARERAEEVTKGLFLTHDLPRLCDTAERAIKLLKHAHEALHDFQDHCTGCIFLRSVGAVEANDANQ